MRTPPFLASTCPTLRTFQRRDDPGAHRARATPRVDERRVEHHAIAPRPRAWPSCRWRRWWSGVKIVWPDVTWGTVLGGTVEGLLTALVALGIAIVYRANRIVNFSAADLGQVPAVLALLLFSSRRLEHLSRDRRPASLASIVLGVLVEFLFLRRFFKAPRLILTVATIGVTEILVALGLLLPQWLGGSEVVQYPPFIDLHFTVGSGLNSTNFFGNDVLDADRRADRAGRARRSSSASPRSASRCAARRRTPTARRCSASRCAGCRASCGDSPRSSRSSRCSCASA